MAADYVRMRGVADRMIRKYGFLAYLRRDEDDRECWVCNADDMPGENPGQLARAVGRIYLVTPIGLSIPPDAEEDLLVTPEGTEKILAPVGKLSPGNVVIYYELRTEGVA